MEVYIDNMLEKNDHIAHLRSALQLIRDHKLKLNPEKVSLVCPQTSSSTILLVRGELNHA